MKVKRKRVLPIAKRYLFSSRTNDLRNVTKFRNKLYGFLVQRNAYIYKEYIEYRQQKHDPLRKRLMVVLHLNWHYRIRRKRTLFVPKKQNNTDVRYFMKPFDRPSVMQMYKTLSSYDVISFDVFDTALYRMVFEPDDVFSIMAVIMEHNDFRMIRRKAESIARERNAIRKLTREVTLAEIYDVLEERYGIERFWMDREIALELALSKANPYILSIYKKLLNAGKTIVFTSDMYLPQNIIIRMLQKNGYHTITKLYLSNEYKARKSDGALQRVLQKDYSAQRIIHVGNNQASDVDQSMAAGLHAMHCGDARHMNFEPDMDNLSGSIYRAIVSVNMCCGLWDKDIHYEHGFRVGGILTAGFCQYIHHLALQKGVDKILFCARDCEIIQQNYNKLYSGIENAYLEISRYSILCAASERYMYDVINRFLLKYVRLHASNKPIGMIFSECGFDFLIDSLESYDIDQYLFPCAISADRMESFLFQCKKAIKEHFLPSQCAAKEYFSEVIGGAKRVLVVDVGWSGTCLSAFQYFVKKHLPDTQCAVHGALMCTSRSWSLKASVESNATNAYVYSPLSNLEFTKFMMPGGKAQRNRKVQDYLHMPLEYLFTSAAETLIAYEKTPEGQIGFRRRENHIGNPDEIKRMQAGICDFIRQYQTATKIFADMVAISPYVAFLPLKRAIEKKEYCYAVYRNFLYDANAPLFAGRNGTETFAALFPSAASSGGHERKERKKNTILFVTPELIYTGAPRSLLRMVRVAIRLGFNAEVWSMKEGPFAAEFTQSGVFVKIVSENELRHAACISQIKSFRMAVCNTIVTDRFAFICGNHIPTVWYIREATNIPDFIQNNPKREAALRNSKSIFCVSEYAAEAISAFTKQKIRIIRNCVEDETEWATPYLAGTGSTVRFVQFGTMEYRKGYDVLLAAYRKMPQKYKTRAELFFAGGFINSGTPFCTYLFREMKQEPNVRYLGCIQGEKLKIKTLSEMDVVVVASRDESCSLVALEGAMLSKPLIVTDRVGAKYMVDESNGYIVASGDVDDLCTAMMRMIDQKHSLAAMGKASREKYENLANMETYVKNLRRLYAMNRKNDLREFIYVPKRRKADAAQNLPLDLSAKDVIVSMTSHPGRIQTIIPCIESLLAQTQMPSRVLLWLSREQFPNAHHDLPEPLCMLETKHDCFSIRWVEEDLKPHKKYVYVMREYPDAPVIIVDDDAIYHPELVGKLMQSYQTFPHCVSAMRTNLIMFRENGEFRDYSGWLMDYRTLRDTPSYQLMPTGVGGVLYPPGAIPKEAFDSKAIRDTCLLCDDLWLKMLACHNGYKTVLPKDTFGYKTIEGTRESALWRNNVYQGNNDATLRSILDYYDQNIGRKEELIQRMQKDHFC